MSTSAVPAEGVECIECLKHGHHAKAIEYVEQVDFKKDTRENVALCEWCRDGDPCPGCQANDRDKAERDADAKKRLQPKEVKKTHEPVAASPKEVKTMTTPNLDDSTIDKAIELRKGGFSTVKVAEKLEIKSYRLYQCTRYMSETRALPHPNSLKSEKTADKARPSRPPVPKTGAISGALLEMREDAVAKIAKLQDLVNAIDRVLAF
jgi:hypothetical protein